METLNCCCLVNEQLARLCERMKCVPCTGTMVCVLSYLLQSQVRIYTYTCRGHLSRISEKSESYSYYFQQIVLKIIQVCHTKMISPHNDALQFKLHGFVCDTAEQSRAGLEGTVLNTVLGQKELTEHYFMTPQVTKT